MKHLKFVIFYIIVVLFLANKVSVYALEVDLNLAQLSTATPTPAPTEELPKPSESASPSANPTPQASPSLVSPTSKPILTITISVSPSISPTAVLSPSKTATMTPTQKPAENSGGSNLTDHEPTPDEISQTPTSTPSPTPEPPVVPVLQTNNPPPVQEAAGQLYRNVVVPPLSFLLQRPKEDFYQDNQIPQPVSYALIAVASAGLLGGIGLLFPAQTKKLYNTALQGSLNLFSNIPRRLNNSSAGG